LFTALKTFLIIFQVPKNKHFVNLILRSQVEILSVSWGEVCSGKSTLLNVLNGNYTPTFGSVTLNGYDIHRQQDQVSGVLGYVA